MDYAVVADVLLDAAGALAELAELLDAEAEKAAKSSAYWRARYNAQRKRAQAAERAGRT